ncbi:SDR family NAD(P)-dependent oxidoreductase [Sphingomonas sp.]|uniref:SDR family NAD(P)-dependent oxidoreductase n=1 Tax=Sphingomonas sp. TaxID=28214 RepID=UPI002C87CD43|nr:SDR family NAD(P)-dependent oxidoreductase [Sphingomonas sp.]HTG39041.1 SDR family NAD(P)-dependent oxidoreductase [Sphingomonas sp.]
MTFHPARGLCSVAITGAGSGLGRDIALAFAARGCIVFGTAASTQEVNEVRHASGKRVSLTACDIANADAATAWAGGVSDALDGAGLDVLISNPSALTPGPIETLPLSAAQRAFDVNVLGALTVINAFLPALRKARGRVIQLSSWTAELALPFDGLSAASMSAIEALAAVYRAELKPFGIDVVVAPIAKLKIGATAEMMAACAVASANMTSDQRHLYGARFKTFATRWAEFHADGIEATDAAAHVIDIAGRSPAPHRAAVGFDPAEMLPITREQSDDERDALRLKLVGLS